ncbi:XRE family transcriptional regulator [Helicobacter jaachi]|uniref:XRE family transcriptional regulator n=1 Tax=Helicobacter jaachi TaxID=1677920 RepID=A0A4U8TC51_9HELI|nr:helix-turn-helix domain-containing protein [Helicobacter jaachi]TLD96818.1 XRE family transcriptional regulator [Helicobacter jaachi]
MKVVDRINEILKAKKMSKKELVERLINLDMKANKTGEIPAKSSLYAYLNGNIELKADMIPFIAEALDVCEQELFGNTDSHKILRKVYAHNPTHIKYNHIVELLDYISPKTLETLEQTLINQKQKTIELNKIIQNL